ncbi:hypothetical protein LOAG_15456 [Loa loa]|uniref:Uncharacterized protein n=1 Tax=Loa loa TaxID=7209 RepID=A0A1S0TFS8_LOALO|nr:hypothetical protein LOAG_15456 [Loa loa]EFO13075.1 hypothetical protein LOAG_15456 [Loa loa]
MKGYEDETEEGIIAKVTENSSSRVGEIVLLDEHETAQGVAGFRLLELGMSDYRN